MDPGTPVLLLTGRARRGRPPARLRPRGRRLRAQALLLRGARARGSTRCCAARRGPPVARAHPRRARWRSTPPSHRVLLRGERVELSQKEFALLRVAGRRAVARVVEGGAAAHGLGLPEPRPDEDPRLARLPPAPQARRARRPLRRERVGRRLPPARSGRAVARRRHERAVRRRLGPGGSPGSSSLLASAPRRARAARAGRARLPRAARAPGRRAARARRAWTARRRPPGCRRSTSSCAAPALALEDLGGRARPPACDGADRGRRPAPGADRGRGTSSARALGASLVRRTPTCPASTCSAIAVRLAQAIGNLIANALQHGGGRVELRRGWPGSGADRGQRRGPRPAGRDRRAGGAPRGRGPARPRPRGRGVRRAPPRRPARAGAVRPRRADRARAARPRDRAVTRRRRALLLAGLALLLGGLAASDVASREAALRERPRPGVARRGRPVGARGREHDQARGARRPREVPARYAPRGAVADPGALVGTAARPPTSPPGRSCCPRSSARRAGSRRRAGPPREGRARRRGRRGGAGRPGRRPAGASTCSSRATIGPARRGAPSSRSRTSRSLAAASDAPQEDRQERPRVAASLRVTLRQAVYLAAAQAFARELRLLPRAPGDRARGQGRAERGRVAGARVPGRPSSGAGDIVKRTRAQPMTGTAMILKHRTHARSRPARVRRGDPRRRQRRHRAHVVRADGQQRRPAEHRDRRPRSRSRGRNFRAGKGKNTVVFKRDGQRAVFVSAEQATTTQIQARRSRPSSRSTSRASSRRHRAPDPLPPARPLRALRPRVHRDAAVAAS